MSDPPYDPGDSLRLRYSVYNAEGSLVSPSVIALTILLSATQAATYSSLGASAPIASAPGVFSVPWTIPHVGTYPMRWESTNPDTAEEFTVRTTPSSFFGA